MYNERFHSPSGSDYDSVLFNSASYTPSILVNVTLNWHGRTQRVVRDQAHTTSTNQIDSSFTPCNVILPPLLISLE